MKTNNLMEYLSHNYKLIEHIVRSNIYSRDSYKDFEDICQEVFLMAYDKIQKNAENYIEKDAEGNIERIEFLSTIIVNCLFDILRKYKKINKNVDSLDDLKNKFNNSDEYYFPKTSSVIEKFEESIDHNEKINEVKALIPELAFEIFILKAEGYKHHEIAEMKGLNLNAIKKILFKSTNIIKENMKK